MIQLILHLFGDYVVQSDWMASRKTSSLWVALLHALTYAVPFLLVASPLGFAVIFLTHALIDRYRIVRYVIWAKNVLSPSEYRRPWKECTKTGYPEGKPDWLAVWLMIVADNTLHLAINALSITYL